MKESWDGVERRKARNRVCLIDPECYFRTKRQVEINTDKIAVLESQIKQFIEAKLIAEGAVKGSKATLIAAAFLVFTSVTLVITLFVFVLNGKLSISDFFKIIF